MKKIKVDLLKPLMKLEKISHKFKTKIMLLLIIERKSFTFATYSSDIWGLNFFHIIDLLLIIHHKISFILDI